MEERTKRKSGNKESSREMESGVLWRGTKFNVQSTISNLFNLFTTIQQSSQLFIPILSPDHFFSAKSLEQCFNCCSNNCFLSVQCAREAASPGASWPADRYLFESGGTTLCEAFCKASFFTSKSHVYQKHVPKLVHVRLFRDPF